MSICKLSDQMKSLYLRALASLKHPEAFSIRDLLEVMFDMPTKGTGKRRTYFPSRAELCQQLHSLPGISTVGIKQAHGQQFRIYQYRPNNEE